MRLLPLLSLITAFALPATGTAADHSHHGASAAHGLELNAGKKWATDAPLRKAMSAIRQASANALGAVHNGKDTPALYEALSKDVKAQVAYMVSNCKLEPKADAQLHVLIAEMMEGAEVMDGKQAGQQQSAGLLAVVRAANAYGVHFAHPGWQMIDH